MTIVNVEKQEYYIFCRYVSVALIIQCAKCVRRIMSSSVACLAVIYFITYLVKCTIFGKEVIEHEMCVVIFPTTFV